MEFSRQESWSGVPFPSPGHLSHPGIKPTSLVRVSCIGRRIFYCCATWELALIKKNSLDPLGECSSCDNVASNTCGKSAEVQVVITLGSASFLFLFWHAAAAAAKSLQPCPTLCDPTDSSPPNSPVPGILQARTLEWVAISFSNAWKWKVKVKSLSRVRPSATPWTEAHQAPPSMGFSRQEYWSGVPLPLTWAQAKADLWEAHWAQAPLRLIAELQAPFLLPCSLHLHGSKLTQVLLWFWWQEVGQQWVLTQGIKMVNSSEFSKSKQFVLFSSNETPLGNELKEKYSWKINL